MRDFGSTEVSGCCVTHPNNFLCITDFVMAAQECSATSTEMDGEDLLSLMYMMRDQGIDNERWARIWLHTHPGMSPNPSQTDEKEFASNYASQQWAIMAILSTDGRTYCRLKSNVGPTITKELQIRVANGLWYDDNHVELPFEGDDHLSRWAAEYCDKVHISSGYSYGSGSSYYGGGGYFVDQGRNAVNRHYPSQSTYKPGRVWNEKTREWEDPPVTPSQMVATSMHSKPDSDATSDDKDEGTNIKFRDWFINFLKSISPRNKPVLYKGLFGKDARALWDSYGVEFPVDWPVVRGYVYWCTQGNWLLDSTTNIRIFCRDVINWEDYSDYMNRYKDHYDGQSKGQAVDVPKDDEDPPKDDEDDTIVIDDKTDQQYEDDFLADTTL